MPHSLRAKLSGLQYKGILEDKDYKRLCHALDLEKAEQEPTTRRSCKTCIGKSRYVDGMDLCEDCENCSNFKPKQTEETIDKSEQDKCEHNCEECDHNDGECCRILFERSFEQEPCRVKNELKVELNELEPCDDVVSREDALNSLIENTDFEGWELSQALKAIEDLPSVRPQEQTGHCKDCKWWKDSDGLYRRGSHAESQCPINRREVLEGNGYCYMFEPQESEDKG